MKIVIITGSAHRHGTTAMLADQFQRGAESAGHEVFRFDAAFKNVHPCIGCDKCRRTGECTFAADDMKELDPHLLEADAVVFVSPIYYFDINAQLKAVIDRFYANNEALMDKKKAILITAIAFDLLGRDHKDILAVTMPCFGTTDRTRDNACILADELGARLRRVDIGEAVQVHFRDIGQSMDDHSVTFENGQARERTQVLMDLANKSGGLVIGTGDLSELALGWATYNGDHMSMYAVNASIPKTLVRHLVAFVSDDKRAEQPKLSAVLDDILDTPVSPELLPAVDGKIAQKTEDLVGPYELHDFFLYYALRWGFGPKKVFRLALYALGDRYERDFILKWLKNFYRRFFNQQFKRSCLPDGPKVGTVTLSPRGDWRMPSDAVNTLWAGELEGL